MTPTQCAACLAAALLAVSAAESGAQSMATRLPATEAWPLPAPYPTTAATPPTPDPTQAPSAWAAAGPAVELDLLTTDELLALYAETYEQSLRGQAFDLSRLALPGHVIFQMGYTFSSDTDELEFTTTEHTFPEFLLRYRLLKRLEIRAGWAGVAINTLTDDLTGVDDRDTRTINPTAGIRVGLWEQHGNLPRTSITISSPYDLDAQGAFRERLTPRGSVGYSWLLDKTTLLSGSTGLIWAEEDGVQYTDFRQSLSVATFVNDDWDLHLTWQALLPEGRSVEDVSHSIGPGFSYRFTPKKQCDVISSLGIDDPSPDLVLQILFTAKL